MHIVGYADRYSVAAGDAVTFMISSPDPTYRAEVVRLIHGDDSPDGPGFKSEPVPSDIEGDHAGAPRQLPSGSYVRIPRAPGLDPVGSLTLQLWMRPTTPDKPRQVLVAKHAGDGTGFALELDHGRLTLVRRAGAGHRSGTLALDRPVALHTWYFVAATFDAGSGEAALRLEPLSPTASELAATARGQLAPAEGGSAAGPGSDLLIGAEPAPDAPGGVSGHYNGKLDSPRLYGRALATGELDHLRRGGDPTGIADLVAAWDFSVGIASSAIADVSGHGYDGVAVQRPARAVTGRNWDGRDNDWTRIPEQYGAIHFHDDDLDDAGWPPSVTWRVPEGTPSGVYALHVTAGADDDYIPFAVRPRLGAPTAPILFQMPTFSYLAYGNEHLVDSPQSRQMMTDIGVDPATLDYPATWQDRYITENHLNSLYDTHTDGSGVFYSSRRRPVLNMRPRYEMVGLDDGHGSPHQFNADLHLLDWLHEQGYPFDVATDEDLHRDGRALLDGYRVVITGTHHEYWASSMLDALRDYLLDGGRLMYLAGNGFYWVAELDPEGGHTVEVRRRGPATRSWDAAGGEEHLSSTGELGGLWRYRNRAPQQLVGVGFTAQGVGAGRPYRRQPGSFDPRAAFVFDGIGADELIGDHPCLVSSYGAAGFEIDRVDHSLGSPHRTIVLATATGFSDSFQHVSEETLMTTSKEGGTVNDLVRADMVLLEYPDGGAVFSPASITWCGSLSWNNYDNTVSRITANVLDRFLEDRPVFDAAPSR